MLGGPPAAPTGWLVPAVACFAADGPIAACAAAGGESGVGVAAGADVFLPGAPGVPGCAAAVAKGLRTAGALPAGQLQEPVKGKNRV